MVSALSKAKSPKFHQKPSKTAKSKYRQKEKDKEKNVNGT